jgi:GTPase SAR1 family protein
VIKQSLQKLKCFSKKPIQTIGIEVESMLVKDNVKISLWDLGGQDEFHAFHDLVAKFE